MTTRRSKTSVQVPPQVPDATCVELTCHGSVLTDDSPACEVTELHDVSFFLHFSIAGRVNIFALAAITFSFCVAIDKPVRCGV